MSEPPAVRLRGLVKRFGRRRALDGVDLSIEGRAIVGVLGPDGAGKTTLLRALAGLMEVEADEALVLGHDLRKDVTALKADVGYVPQVFSLHRDLTVCENLRFTARVARMDAADFEARSAELLARTRLAPFADRAAGKLSGGMKQKLAIANALLPRPRLVLLDEATAGVDVIARDEIWALLGQSLRVTLSRIRRAIIDAAPNTDPERYFRTAGTLSIDTRTVAVDVRRFVDHIEQGLLDDARGNVDGAKHHYRAAHRLYTDRLLASEGPEPCLESRVADFESLYEEALTRLMSLHAATGELDLARDFARELLARNAAGGRGRALDLFAGSPPGATA